MVIAGQVLESWTASLRSFSAAMRISAALLRSTSDIMAAEGPFRSLTGGHEDDRFLRTFACARIPAGQTDRRGAVLRRAHVHRPAAGEALGPAGIRRRRPAVGSAVRRYVAELMDLDDA